MENSHVKLLAFDFHSLTQKPCSSSSDPFNFFRKGKQVSRIETLGVVVSRDRKGDRFLKFLIDDGTECISCILWLNQLDSPYFSRRNPSDVRIIAQMAKDRATDIQLGVLARVRGRITSYRGALQVTVEDVFIERDANAEILHWLDCVKLARSCYNVSTRPSPLQALNDQSTTTVNED
ncbi:hypothetical protein IFM89_020861 [Coptis chinensis]|uniref:CST complex subunit STN1 n=1 Tax=Coptis chinensis TaxID=261450 RepID=A0A835IWU9_9MAGN|nr:hypothetical protein IFM89_020861 [Coptis chinensis]